MSSWLYCQYMSNPTLSVKHGDEGWRDRFISELAKLDRLPSDNGSLGPNKPSPDIIGIAYRIPEDVNRGKLPFPQVIAMGTSEGGIQIKWLSISCEFSIFIYPNRTLEYLLKDSEGRYTSGGLTSVYQINTLADQSAFASK